MIPSEIGIAAVKAARETVMSETEGSVPDIDFPKEFDDNYGVFVTLNTYPEGDLRGCIGYPEPAFPLKDALMFSAQSACHDPRFPPLSRKEAERCTVEVTILTPPEPVDKSRIPDCIEIGRDGLIIRFGRRSGVLLPQVAEEWGWTKEEYLAQLCLKAGLPTDAWTFSDAELYSFQGEIYREVAPCGEIEGR